MPKLICTSRYIKNSKSKNAGNLIKYMGTREGVEKLSNGYDNSPASVPSESRLTTLSKMSKTTTKICRFKCWICSEKCGMMCGYKGGAVYGKTQTVG